MFKIYCASHQQTTYYIKGDLIFDENDMTQLYNFFKICLVPKPSHPLKTQLIAFAIDNILRSDKHHQIRMEIHNLYEDVYPGYIDEINKIVHERDIEETKKIANQENEYEEKDNDYNLKCTKAILQYLEGEDTMIETIETSMREYMKDTKKELPFSVIKSL